MSITSLTSVPQDQFGTFLLTAISSLLDAVFYWYENGIFVGTNTTGQRKFVVLPSQQSRIEVFDDPDDMPEGGYPSQSLLAWDSVNGAQEYRIEKWDGASWETKGVRQQTNKPHYQYVTEILADDTLHRFQVIPVSNGNDGLEREYSFLMIRRPDAPTIISETYDEFGAKLLRITAA